MMDQVLKQIEQREAFLLTSHARPDGDAVGSLLALYQVLLQRGKQAVPVLGDPVPLLYKGLPFADCIRHTSTVQEDCDAVIVLECDSLQRTRVTGLEHLF